MKSSVDFVKGPSNEERKKIDLYNRGVVNFYKAKFLKDLKSELNQEVVLNIIDTCYKHGDNYFAELSIDLPNEIACKKGCGYCCHTIVMVTPAELFYIYNYIMTSLDDLTRAKIFGGIKNQVQYFHGRSWFEIYSNPRKLRCPMLIDFSCSIYQARTFVCRGYHGIKKNFCKNQYQNNLHISQANYGHLVDVYLNHLVAVGEACEEVGLEGDYISLVKGLGILIDQPDAMEKWMNGEKVFADAAVDKAFLTAVQI